MSIRLGAALRGARNLPTEGYLARKGLAGAALYANFIDKSYVLRGSDERSRWASLSDFSFSRASTAYYVDASGSYAQAASGVARFDYDPSTLAPLGLLVEGARTNVVRNSSTAGAAVGTTGSLPTNWSGGPPAPLVRETVSVGTSGGVECIANRWSGTTSASGTYTFLEFDAPTQFTAGAAQTWAASVFVALAAGSLTGVTAVGLRILEADASGNILEVQSYTFTPGSGALHVNRQTIARTLTNASTARIRFTIYVTLANATAVDFALLVGWPQLELGPFASSPIRTTSGAVARAADSLTYDVSTMLPAGAGACIFVDAELPALLGSSTPYPVLLAGATPINDRWGYYLIGSPIQGIMTGTLTSVQANFNHGTISTRVRGAARIFTNDTASSLNGGAALTDTSAALPAAWDKLYFGTWSSAPFFGRIRSIGLTKKLLSNAELQSLSTHPRAGVPTHAGALLGTETTGIAFDFVARQAVLRRASGGVEYAGALSGLPGLSFSRASVATLVTDRKIVESAASGVLRFEHSLFTGTPLGALLEGARTNLVLNSVFANSGGVAPTSFAQALGGGTSAPAASTVNPSVSAYAQTASAERPMITQAGLTLSANTTYVMSMTVEAVSGTISAQDLLRFSAAPAGATVSWPVCSANPSGGGASLVVPGRLAMVVSVANTAGYTSFYFGLGCNGAVTGSVRFSMPQVELGPNDTSFIPTTTAAVVRAADLLTMPSAGLVGATEGTLFIDALTAAGPIQGNNGLLQIDDGTNTNRLTLYQLGGADRRTGLYIASGGVASVNQAVGTSITLGGRLKVALTWGVSGAAISINGAAAIAFPAAVVPSILSTLRIGGGGIAGSVSWGGPLARGMALPRALSNSELQALTA